MSNDICVKHISKRGKDILKIVTNHLIITTTYEWEKKKTLSVL